MNSIGEFELHQWDDIILMDNISGGYIMIRIKEVALIRLSMDLKRVLNIIIYLLLLTFTIYFFSGVWLVIGILIVSLVMFGVDHVSHHGNLRVVDNT